MYKKSYSTKKITYNFDKTYFYYDDRSYKDNSINIVYVNYDSLFGGDELLDLAISCNAIQMINESLKTDNCEKSKVMLKILYDRYCYNYQKQEKLKEKHTHCTIS